MIDRIGKPGYLARVLVAVAVATCGLALVAGAAARPARTTQKPLVLHRHFRPAGRASTVLTDGRYVFLVAVSSVTAASGTVVDEHTGRRVVISRPGCGDPQFAGPWLVFDCPGRASWTLARYALSSGTWSTVVIDQSIQEWCAINPSPGSCGVVAVGADWIEVDEDCYHCGDRHLFQNMQTGVVRGPPHTGASTILDLGSPTLTHRVCSSLPEPRHGWLAFFGRFAIAQFSNRSFIYLERCGSRLRLRLAAFPVASNTHSLISAAKGRLLGIFLPSLRRFVIPLPRGSTLTQFVLSSRTLYAFNNRDQLWTARGP